ncbi:molybdate ABC transporter substrate-binding protein [Ammonifex thiophilus]|uniref:Molybdate ABC transporter substrate-binding protein n=1 Tax=Ammonifex thiophilus TaxID=444093 RepID=A0A3D8P694_9THEO|nr:molybdate ABC transporter substrate-binding protein [Ammonifex thiophilus]RDV84844.1 molybdate ABC transporter substrate-binding protein [Ammonifex thiophilus]
MRRLLALLLLGGIIMTLLAGCKQQPQAQPKELRIFAAAGLKKPMDEVIARFEQEKGVKVIPNYGPSGGLWAQIKEGQPCDLFYSADWMYIEMAQKEGKIAEAKKFLQDELALVVAPSAKDKVKSVADLAKPGVTVAVCDPRAPVGDYSEKALKKLGLWDKIQSNLKARPPTVNQAAIMVKEDQIDATLIFQSVAQAYGLKPVELIGPQYTGEIIFGVGVIKGGHEALAREFMNYAFQHVDIFTKYGWKPYAP